MANKTRLSYCARRNYRLDKPEHEPWNGYYPSNTRTAECEKRELEDGAKGEKGGDGEVGKFEDVVVLRMEVGKGLLKAHGGREVLQRNDEEGWGRRGFL